MRPIGAKIQDLRRKRGWSQEELASRAGIGRSALGNYETGIRNIGLDVLEQLADAFGMTLGEMVNEGEAPVEKPLPSNVRPISALHRQRVPLIGGVAAGEPIYDPEDAGIYVDSPVEADAAITIHGDSMVPTYQDGDLVYIKCRPDVPEGAVAVVFLDDEATLKHVYKRPTGLTLISDNMATHPPIMVEFEDYANVRIFGVPVGYTRIYKPSIEGKITKGFKRQDR